MKTTAANKIGDDEETAIQVTFNLVSHVVSSPLNERLQSVLIFTFLFKIPAIVYTCADQCTTHLSHKFHLGCATGAKQHSAVQNEHSEIQMMKKKSKQQSRA